MSTTELPSTADKARTRKKQVKPTIQAIEVPLGPVSTEENLPERIDIKCMPYHQRLALKKLLRGLEFSGAKLTSGAPVTRPTQAVQWLLEQVE